MPLWFWVLIVVGTMLAFGWIVDERRTRRLMLGSGRKERRAALAERHRLHAGVRRWVSGRIADAERIQPGTVSQQHGLNQQQQQQTGGGMGGPVG